MTEDCISDQIRVFIDICRMAFPIIGIISVFINIFVLVALRNVETNKFYRLVKIRVPFKIFASLIYMGIDNTPCIYCESNYYNWLWILIFKTEILTAVADFLSTCVGLIEIIIAWGRLNLLKNTESFFSRLQTRYNTAIAFLLSLFLSFPALFGHDYKYVGNGIYYFSFNEFKFNYYLNLYVYISNLIKLFLVIIYFTLTILVLIEFKRFLHNKLRLTASNQSRISVHETNLVKLVVTNGFFYALGAVIKVITAIFSYQEDFQKTHDPYFFDKSYMIIRFSMYVISFALFCSCDGTLLFFDNNIRLNFFK